MKRQEAIDIINSDRNVTLDEVKEIVSVMLREHRLHLFYGDEVVEARLREIENLLNRISTEATPQSDEIRDIINYLNEKTGAKFRYCESNNKFIRARLKDYSIDEIKAVIDAKVAEWKGTTMEKYLRPETLFNATKFESYAGSVLANMEKQKSDKSVAVGNGVYKL